IGEDGRARLSAVFFGGEEIRVHNGYAKNVGAADEVCAVRTKRRLGEREPPPHVHDCRRSNFFESRKNGSVQSCPGTNAVAYRKPATGKTEHGQLGNIRVGNGESKLAGLCSAYERRKFSRCGKERVGQRIFAFRVSRRTMQERRRPGFIYQR